MRHRRGRSSPIVLGEAGSVIKLLLLLLLLRRDFVEPSRLSGHERGGRVKAAIRGPLAVRALRTTCLHVLVRGLADFC